MAEIIDLNGDLFSDCESCREPTKGVAARTKDVEGPGMPGVIYDCDNRRCKARNNAIASYILRREIFETFKAKTNDQAADGKRHSQK